MNIFINLQPLQEFFAQDPNTIMWKIVLYYGWIILGYMYILAARVLWLEQRQDEFASKIKYTFLAIDVPRANEQSPKAVENLFTYLAGAHGSVNFYEKWWEGKFQVGFSFEIVSIDGYTQFIVRTPVDFKGLVESAIYSQYPDSEITEIDDYTEGAPKKFPNDEYDIWGTEYIQAANHMFPIKVYKEFEHQMGPSEAHFRDPIASLMDLCSSLQRGEQLWYQIIIIPTDFEWIKEADGELDKIIGKKPKVSKANEIIDMTSEWISGASEAVYSIWGDLKPKPDKEFKALSMMELKPHQKKKVEGLYEKSSKLGFLVKIRLCYLAKKDVFNPKKTVNGFVGYIKQFGDLHLNSFKPDMKYTATSTAFFAKVKRLAEKKTKIINNYIARSAWSGRDPKILNVEELATIWHFPIDYVVKAPLVQKTPGKKGKPPISLPSEENIVYSESLEPIYSVSEAASNREVSPSPSVKSDDNASEQSGAAPSNLPFA
ncbi:MAG: hypothetical protein WCK37_02715 [Candidatus Falkowbacteria bacterium]